MRSALTYIYLIMNFKLLCTVFCMYTGFLYHTCFLGCTYSVFTTYNFHIAMEAEWRTDRRTDKRMHRPYKLRLSVNKCKEYIWIFKQNRKERNFLYQSAPCQLYLFLIHWYWLTPCTIQNLVSVNQCEFNKLYIVKLAFHIYFFYIFYSIFDK